MTKPALKDDVLDMIGDFEPGSGDEEVKSEPVEEETPEEIPSNEEPSEEKETEEVEVESETSPKPDPTTTEPAETDNSEEGEDGSDELTRLKSQNEQLLKFVEELSGTTAEPGTPITSVEAPAPIPAETKQEVLNFLADVDLDDVLDSKEKLNELLVKVYNKAREDGTTAAANRAVEQVVKNLPKLVVEYNNKHVAMVKVVDDFYTANADLKKVSKTLAKVADSVHREFPDRTVEDTLKEAAMRTRKMLGISASVGRVSPPGGKKPAFAPKSRGGKGRATGPGLKGVAKEVNDLLD